MDKLNNSEQEKKLLQGLGLYIDEAVVRQVLNVLSGKSHQSLYSFYATRPDKPAPVCGKGSVYKIKTLYDEGKLQPYLDYLSDSPTIGEAKAEQILEAKHDVPKESRAEQVPYEETPHKQKIRETTKALAERIRVPYYWDRDSVRDLPVEFQPGKYSLSIDMVEIGENRQMKVLYYDPGAGIDGSHLVKGLYSHLNTSGLPKFAELVGDKGKLNNWVSAVGQYSQALLMFLKFIADDVKGYRAKVSFRDEAKPGLTKWFVLTAWNDILQQAGGFPWIDDSWYKPHESIPDTNLQQLKCGSYIIGIAKSKITLKTYENWHKKLRVNSVKHQSAKDLHAKSQELSNVAQEIRQRLLEFSDMERLPGRCELC
jgi:hypothetical protein